MPFTAVEAYLVVQYNVTLRYHEFAMRMALGATPHGIRRLALGQLWKLPAIGINAGSVA